jgi:hypothetical protein
MAFDLGKGGVERLRFIHGGIFYESEGCC